MENVSKQKKRSVGSGSLRSDFMPEIKNPGERYIMLGFHLIVGLLAYGKWTWESPAFKILALIAQN